MSIIGWLVIGAVCGVLSSRLGQNRSDGWIIDVILGVSGAAVGGLVSCHVFGGDSLAAVNVESLAMAFAGAFGILALYHVVMGHRMV